MLHLKETLSAGTARLSREAGVLRSRLSDPIDAAPLAYFRVVFGLVMVWEVYRYWSKGWIERYWVEPQMFFTYTGFGWVTPWPEPWMHVHFAVLGVAAGAVALGLAYRLAMPLFTLGFWYIFLLDQTNYLNHFYLIGLVSTLMVFMPAHRYLSVDAVLSPAIRSRWAPAWSLWMIRFQLGIAYVFGGVAKINGDWLRGRPMDDWLRGSGDVPLIGGFLESSLAPLVLSWGGLAFDLLIVPALLYSRTRVAAVVVLAAFHLTNSAVFSIGIFPWLMLAATPVFFEVPWRWFRHSELRAPHGSSALKQWLAPALGLYALVQVAVPFRHVLYPGNVSWTEEGHNFAWHMKLRDKTGRVSFMVHAPDGTRWELDHERYLSERQSRKMSTRPALLAQFARKVAPQLERDLGVEGIRITARTAVSLNGRPRRPLVDPEADLVSVKWGVAPASWVLPLEERTGPARANR